MGDRQRWLGYKILWVADSRMLCYLPRSSLVHPAHHFYSSAVTRWYCNVYHVFFVKKHAAFKWKDAISGYPVCQGSTEELLRWGGNIKYTLIAYFLGNTFAKKYHNQTVYVKIVASQRWDFFETHCIFTRHVCSSTSIWIHIFSLQCAYVLYCCWSQSARKALLTCNT